MELNEKETPKSMSRGLVRMMEHLIVVNLTLPVSKAIRLSEEERAKRRDDYIASGGSSGEYDRGYATDDQYVERPFAETSVQSGQLTYFKVSDCANSAKERYTVEITLNEKVQVLLQAGMEDQSFTIETATLNSENVF